LTECIWQNGYVCDLVFIKGY